MPTRTVVVPNRNFPIDAESLDLERLNAATWEVTFSGNILWTDQAGVRTNVLIGLDIDSSDDPSLDLPFFRFAANYVPTQTGLVTQPFSFAQSFVLPSRQLLKLQVANLAPTRTRGDDPRELIFGPADTRLTTGRVVFVS